MTAKLLKTRSEEETRDFGSNLAELLKPDGTLLLYGELGSGKTVLTQGVARGLGIDPAQVQSPTFTLVRHHRSDESALTHIDLYRLEGEEVEAIGIWEILAGAGVKVIEWAERLTLPVEDALQVEIESGERPDERVIRMRRFAVEGDRSQERDPSRRDERQGGLR